MNRRSQTVSVVLVFLVILSCIAGCTSVRTADTHNTTTAIQSYNSWTVQQQGTDRNVRGTIALISDHVTTYNTEIVKDQPDFSALRENLATDKQALDRWGASLDSLSAATDGFESNTSALIYDNATAKQTKQTLGLMTQYMRIHTIESGNARQHLIEYVKNAEAYIGPDDPEYWNEQYRLDAILAKEQAQGSLFNGDVALRNLTTQAQQLEQLQ
jgi:uncharacterized protein YceK